MPRLRLPGELAFTGLLLGFSLLALWQAYLIAGFSSPSSAGVFPMLAAATMVVSGLVIVETTRRQAPLAPAGSESGWQLFRRRVTPRVLIGFTGLMVAYLLLLDQLGFLFASYLFLVASMWLLGRRRLWSTLPVSAVVLAVIHLIFQTVFSVVLPKGRLLGNWPVIAGWLG